MNTRAMCMAHWLLIVCVVGIMYVYANEVYGITFVYTGKTNSYVAKTIFFTNGFALERAAIYASQSESSTHPSLSDIAAYDR